MNVFITGAAGFIGGSIATGLVKAGHKVTGLVRSAEHGAACRPAQRAFDAPPKTPPRRTRHARGWPAPVFGLLRPRYPWAWLVFTARVSPGLSVPMFGLQWLSQDCDDEHALEITT